MKKYNVLILCAAAMMTATGCQGDSTMYDRYVDEGSLTQCIVACGLNENTKQECIARQGKWAVVNDKSSAGHCILSHESCVNTHDDDGIKRAKTTIYDLGDGFYARNITLEEKLNADPEAEPDPDNDKWICGDYNNVVLSSEEGLSPTSGLDTAKMNAICKDTSYKEANRYGLCLKKKNRAVSIMTPAADFAARAATDPPSAATAIKHHAKICRTTPPTAADAEMHATKVNSAHSESVKKK